MPRLRSIRPNVGDRVIFREDLIRTRPDRAIGTITEIRRGHGGRAKITMDGAPDDDAIRIVHGVPLSWLEPHPTADSAWYMVGASS